MNNFINMITKEEEKIQSVHQKQAMEIDVEKEMQNESLPNENCKL